MFTEFVRDRIEKATKPLSDVIPRANLFTFTNRPSVDLKKGARELGSAKANTALVTKLFMFLQARPDLDIDDFFKLENQREPPSLSDQGKLQSGTKSDILRCLPGMPGLYISYFLFVLDRVNKGSAPLSSTSAVTIFNRLVFT